MSTGRNKIKLAEDLIKWLELENTEFNKCKPLELMSMVFSSVENIWENVDLENYTEHGLRHSIAIIDYFLQLDSLLTWSDYEKFIFSISALIHDIGMQYNRWGFSVELPSDIPALRLSPEKIRELHHILGFELIEKLIKNGSLSGFPKKMFNHKSQVHLNAIFKAQYIAFSHTGDEYLNELISNKKETWKMREYLSEKYRPRLLAGVLKICDELDGNFERIPEPDRIEATDLDETNRIHWFACLFVENIFLEVIDRITYIDIKWQAPDQSTDRRKKLIKDFIREHKIMKIQKEISAVDKFFEQCNELCHCTFTKNIYIKPLSQEPIFTKFSVKEDLMENILLYRSTSKKVLVPSKIKGVLQKSISNTKRVDKTTKRLIDKKFDKLLDNWFEMNRESGHFELISGDHTDTYVYCRSLASNQDLLDRITKHIWKIHKRHNIKNILAIGTSAIPIAVNLSFRFKSFLTYTFWSKKFFDKIYSLKSNKTNIIKGEKYNFSELMPSIRDGENILIIDDVISGGRIVVDILNFIEKLNKKGIGEIYHHAIFRLGNRNFIEDKRITEYTWTKHIKNIMYASSKEECTFCKEGWIFQKEEDMY